ncbi:hypothetical protein HF995_02045 [Sanguibacter hominis ATCC BAA-789]|uniref:histidine kinase n=1 Tax=Sanguibacter hominis ATCC BAA-789 TaxID=1312740 RepID=A0A9X5F9K8_9MICO|nr:ATP-binding protein [Sanguibacter hominis]NKX92065.1 hypothetical protein [Sanguibacter hominis ATCC BAA-789]
MPTSLLMHTRTRSQMVLLHVALLAVALALGSGAASLARGGPVSLWWPASGVAVLAVLALPRELRWLGLADVAVVTTVANVLAHRDPLLAAGHGVANAVEAGVVVLVLMRGRRIPALVTMNDLLRLLVGACFGALAGSGVSAVGFLAATGEVPVRALLTIVTSHASAILIIVPVVIGGNHPAARRGPGHVAQAVLLLAVVLLVFWPGIHLPLTYLPMPLLVWATFLFSTRHVALQLLLVAAAVTTLTTLGGGPFATDDRVPDPGVELAVMQIFLLTYGVSILAFAVTQEERRHLRDHLAEREQILQGGIVDAQFGLIIMNEISPDQIQVLQSNRLAARLLPEVPFVRRDLLHEADGEEPELPLLPLDAAGGSAFIDAIDSVRMSPRGEVYAELAAAGGRHLELHLTRAPRGNGEALLTAQLIDVTQQRRADAATLRALEDERAAAEHLRDLNQQKDDFVSTVSHELRTPVTSILGFVELLIDETDPTEEQSRHLAVIERNALRLRNLVEDLLAVGAGAQGRAVPVPTDVQALAADVVEELTPSAQRREVTLQLLPGAPVRGLVAPSDIARVVTNLVTNAIKFTPAGGLVAVQVAERADDVVLTVTDTGVGIKREDLDRVFDRFYRSSSASSRKVPGAGLGLTLVRSLVTRNGGTVDLTSNGTSGTQATVHLPAVRPDPAPVAAPEPAHAPDVP